MVKWTMKKRDWCRLGDANSVVGINLTEELVAQAGAQGEWTWAQVGGCECGGGILIRLISLAGMGNCCTSSSQYLGSSSNQWLKGFGVEKYHCTYHHHCTDYYFYLWKVFKAHYLWNCLANVCPIEQGEKESYWNMLALYSTLHLLCLFLSHV